VVVIEPRLGDRLASMKTARRRGDAAQAAEAKSKRDALVTDLKQAARDLRNGN
jgi:hypothetical protein